MKKTILIPLIILVLVIGATILSLLNFSTIRNAYCEIKGGKVFQHSFDTNCEMKAKDAGKQCTYNNECTLECQYPVPNDFSTRSLGTYKYPETMTNGGGKCDDYSSDEGIHCNRDQGKDVKCDFIIS